VTAPLVDHSKYGKATAFPTHGPVARQWLASGPKSDAGCGDAHTTKKVCGAGILLPAFVFLTGI
jgi:hypothetical protein